MSKPEESSGLQMFLLLAKNARGLAAVEIIKQVLEHNQVYVFGELLVHPNIKALQDDPQYEPYYRLLELFAYQNYRNYDGSKYPQLTPAMETKLRYLTVVSLANKSKTIKYSQLMEELVYDNQCQLEATIIDLIYLNLIKGKMDQKNSWFEIESTISRDVREEQLDTVITVLSDWCGNCNNVLADIEAQIRRANKMKIDFLQKKSDLDGQIAEIEKNIDNTHNSYHRSDHSAKNRNKQQKYSKQRQAMGTTTI